MSVNGLNVLQPGDIRRETSMDTEDASLGRVQQRGNRHGLEAGEKVVIH